MRLGVVRCPPAPAACWLHGLWVPARQACTDAVLHDWLLRSAEVSGPALQASASARSSAARCTSTRTAPRRARCGSGGTPPAAARPRSTLGSTSPRHASEAPCRTGARRCLPPAAPVAARQAARAPTQHAGEHRSSARRQSRAQLGTRLQSADQTAVLPPVNGHIRPLGTLGSHPLQQVRPCTPGPCACTRLRLGERRDRQAVPWEEAPLSVQVGRCGIVRAHGRVRFAEPRHRHAARREAPRLSMQAGPCAGWRLHTPAFSRAHVRLLLHSCLGSCAQPAGCGHAQAHRGAAARRHWRLH